MDAMYGVSDHGELAGLGAAVATFLRGDDTMLTLILRCLRRHGLATTAADVGLTSEQLLAAVMAAPQTRPDRYTILEHLGLDESQTRERLAAYEERARVTE